MMPGAVLSLGLDKLCQLIDSIPDEWDSKDLKKCIMSLFKYTREHFEAEEKLLVAIDYPKLEEHRHLHEDLISHLVKVSEDGVKDEQALLDFKEFAYNWITDHILQQDHQYLKFVKDNSLSW